MQSVDSEDAFGAVRGGHLAEKVILRCLVLFKTAAGAQNRWAALGKTKNIIRDHPIHLS